MKNTNLRKLAKERRHSRIRKSVKGTPERPRLAVSRSLKHIYAQVIDDTQGKTLIFASSLESDVNSEKGTKTQTAAAVGKVVAERAIRAGISQVVFDRGGNLYHGRVKAVAEAARGAGLQF